MHEPTLIPVILAGGSGTRLWPRSRQQYPKQLLRLTGDLTMLQATLARLDGLATSGPPLVICNDQHRFMVAEQLRQQGTEARIILEPVGRNTAPAAAVAALAAVAACENPLLLVMPADHLLDGNDGFCRAVRAGIDPAIEGGLIAFGVEPTSPETGYGYIRKGAAVKDAGRRRPAVHEVEEFVEKPGPGRARRYVGSGEYLWNSGMFLFAAASYLEELERHAPEMLAACRRAYEQQTSDLDFIRLPEERFAGCPADSIDYAVMEKTGRAMVVPLACGWSDIGSWSALWESGEQDSCGNVITGDVVTHDVHHCYLHAESRLLAAVGIGDHVVVETADAVMVAHKSKVQQVKQVVAQLEKQGRSEVFLHRRVFRPWGCYDSIDRAERFQVKRITVKPGGVLSSQMHHHRAEHWIVVRGTARVIRGNEEILLSENESTYIPVGARHRLENPGRIPLELIEVQSGSYLGEDDIVRYEDLYGRN